MRRVLKWMSFGITCFLLSMPVCNGSALPTAAQPTSSGWQVVGQIGGPTSAVAVQDDYAYVGVGLRLVVLSVSDPASPTEVGSTTPLPRFVEDVAVSGAVAYVAAGDAGLRVVDVSDPAGPTEIGTWDSPGYAEGVTVVGPHVYVADGHYGLRIVDVSDPASPQEVGYSFPLNYAFDVVVVDQHAYVASAGAGLLIADVSDPTDPAELGLHDTPGYAFGVSVESNTAYIADAAGVFAFDKGSPLAGPYLTATATDGEGNTSEFSAPIARPIKVYLPIILKGH